MSNGSSDGSDDGSMTRAQRISLSLDRNLSVTAGAGTGKTRVLTSRFLKILGEGRERDHLGVRGGAPPSRIVAVTFTRKAANEMRERVTKEITARVEAAIETQDADEYRFWVQVRRDMDDATITTIHGLAARLVRMAALELQVDPKFRVVEGIDARLLLEEAVSVALSAPPPESLGPLRELYLLRGGKAVRDLLRALVGDRVHADPWAKSLVENEADAVLDAVWREFVPVDEVESRGLVQEVADVHARLLRNGEMLSRPPEPGSKAAVLLDCLRSCAQSVEDDHRVRTTAVCRLLSLCTSNKGEWYKQPHYAMGKGGDWKQMGCEGVDKDLFDALKGPLAPWAGRLTGVPGEQDERMMVLLRGIARLYLEVTRHYDQAKSRRGVLDYHDLEGHARRALRSPGVAEAIRRRIRYLLVDEFQDTNVDQWAILRALAVASDAAPEGWDDHGEGAIAEEGAWASVADRVQEEEGGPVGPSAQGKPDPLPRDETQKGMQSLQLTNVGDGVDPEEEPLGEDRLFIVGDAKQSIYAFRGADVAVYQESRRKVQQANEYHGLDQEPLPEVGQKGPPIELEKRTREQGGEVALDRNFRSLPALVSFTNHFFDRLLAPYDPENPQTYEAEPGPLEGHRKRLVHDAQERSRWAQGSVRLLLTPRELGRAVDRGDCTKGDADRLGPTRYQFLRMVQDIKDHASPDTNDPLLVADGKTDDDGVARGRPAQYRDVAVLLPRKRNLRILEEVLREQGVPYVVVAGRGFWSKQEVWDAVNLLSVVADPRRDVELLGVLRSPFFAWNDEALAWLAAAEGSSLWQRLVKIEKGETEGSPPVSFEGLPPAQVVAEVRRWRGLASTSGAARLLMDMLERTGYLASLRAREPESAGRLGVENLEKLVSLVRELESRRGRSIGPLVRDLLSLADQDAEEAEAQLPGEEEVGVRVMTVHAAKGLQFPVCYVAETNAQMQTGAFQDARGVVFDRLGDQPFYALKARGLDGEVEGSFTYDALNKRALPREQAEQKRLLYVAATRAEDHLVFVGSSTRLGPREGQKAPALQPFAQGKCWLDWLEYAFGLDEGMHDDLVQEGERRRWFELGGPEGTETARVLVDVQAPIVGRPHDPRAQDGRSAPDRSADVGDEGVVEVVPALDLPSTQAVRVSPSQLSLYAECKARFRFGVLEGMSEGWVRGVQAGAPDYAAAMGSMLHRALASGATEETPVPAPVLTRAKALARRWEGKGWPSPQQAEDHLTRHANKALATLAAQFGTEPVLSETDLEAEVAKGLRVVGRLDRVHHDRDGRLVVVDLKTDEVPKSEQETAKEHGHDVQVLLYDAALRQAGHETAPPALLYSSTGRLLRIEPTPGEPTVVEDLAERVAQSNEHTRAAKTANGDPLDSIWPRDARDRATCRGCGFWQGNQGPCPGISNPSS